MVQTQFRILAAHCARGLVNSYALDNQRAQGIPDARCTRGLACGLHKTKCTRAYRAAENTRPSLRNGFTAYGMLSPENGSFASVAPRKLLPPGALTPAPRRQDHTLLPYASVALRLRNISVHRSPPNVRDDGRRPSDQDGMAKYVPLICLRIKRNIFHFWA